MKNTLKAIGHYLVNKTASLIVLAVSIAFYLIIPSGWSFVELAYTAVTVLGVITLAPILRLLVFAEAAFYAESGALNADIAAGKFTPALCHYWFATAVCYLAPLACIAGISK
jgi:hypothetical protein